MPTAPLVHTHSSVLTTISNLLHYLYEKPPHNNWKCGYIAPILTECTAILCSMAAMVTARAPNHGAFFAERVYKFSVIINVISGRFLCGFARHGPSLQQGRGLFDNVYHYKKASAFLF